MRVLRSSGGTESSGARPSNFAVRPSSVAMERHLEVKDGCAFWHARFAPGRTVIHEFLPSRHRHDLRLRFFAPMKEFTPRVRRPADPARLCPRDGLCRVRRSPNEMVGVVRIHPIRSTRREYAIPAQIRSQGKGWVGH